MYINTEQNFQITFWINSMNILIASELPNQANSKTQNHKTVKLAVTEYSIANLKFSTTKNIRLSTN